MDAAREVAGADVDLDLLESLLDKSLLRHRLNGVGQDPVLDARDHPRVRRPPPRCRR